MLRENRLSILPEDKLTCKDPKGFMLKLKDQMNVYSYQFKEGDIFGKTRVALSGKVGGMKDDIVNPPAPF
jgi:hypothetical protein